MKILYVITRADSIGGAQVHVRDLAVHLSSEGHEIHVVAGSAGLLAKQVGLEESR